MVTGNLFPVGASDRRRISCWRAMEVQEPHPVAAHPLSDEEVVARVCAGDGGLYEVLMRRHNQRMYRAVRSILRGEDDVEDVLQEAWLAAFVHLEGFDGRARVSTWLVRIAVNKALDRLRRSSRLVGLDGWPEEDLVERSDRAGGPRDPEAQSASRELTRLLHDAIDVLPAVYRSVYVLREVEGLSTEETAACLGIEQGTAKTRLHRARARLREQLERKAGASVREAFGFGAARCDALVAHVLARIR